VFVVLNIVFLLVIIEAVVGFFIKHTVSRIFSSLALVLFFLTLS
jgi:hypothetical protein